MDEIINGRVNKNFLINIFCLKNNKKKNTQAIFHAQDRDVGLLERKVMSWNFDNSHRKSPQGHPRSLPCF